MKPETITVHWNGGWDKVELDRDNTRPVSPDEQFNYDETIRKGFGGYPWIDNYTGWVRNEYVGGTEGACTKVLRHIDGGD